MSSYRQVLTVVGQVVGAYVTAGSSWGAAIGGQIGPALGTTLDGPDRLDLATQKAQAQVSNE
jgi:hypothetical protein